MKRASFAIGAFAVAAAFAAQAPFASAAPPITAPFAWSADAANVLRLDGDLTAGTAEIFAAALAAHPQIDTLVLSGGGESLADSMAIARAVHDAGMATVIEPEAHCDVACAVVFLAGTTRRAEGVLSVGMMFPDTADVDALQEGAADLIELLLSFRLSDDIVAAVMGSTAESSFFFSRHELTRLGVNLPDLDPPAGVAATPYAVLHESPAPDAPANAPWPSYAATASWSLSGNGTAAVVQLDIDVAAVGLHFTARFATNPGTNTLEMTAEATVPAGFAGGGIRDVALFRPRPRQVGHGRAWLIAEELDGAGPYHFLVNETPLAAPFVRTLLGREWMSFVVRYANGEIGELLLEVGADGRAAIDAALAAWGL